MQPTLANLTQEAQRLKAAGRIDEAINAYRRAVSLYPGNGVALHNLAGALGDVAAHAEAETIAASALKTGLDAPETWLVLARAQLGQGKLEPSRKSYAEVIRRRPDILPAQFEMAQLVWMSTGDREAALADIRAAAARPGAPVMLRFLEAQALEFMEEPAGARAALEPALQHADCPSEILALAADIEARLGRPDLAVGLAERAFAKAAGHPGALEALIRARLAAGDGAGASAAAADLISRQPGNQHALALQATAWRMLGDSRYRNLYDYGRFVSVDRLDVPKGWADLDAYVLDLAAELKQAHPFRTHPFGHSVRYGSQRPHVLMLQTPAIAAFLEALQGPLSRHLQRIGQGSDVLTRRNTGRVGMIGNWSVWLRPGGYHVDHVHQEGWLSSACYIELPPAVSAGCKEGWLRFGRPGIPVAGGLEAEHWVRPEPGVVALFPSYMWHGTEAFTGTQPRLTIAFDLVPI